MTASDFMIRSHVYHEYDSGPIKLDIAYDPIARAQVAMPKALVYFHAGGLICGNRNLMFPEFAIKLLLRKGWLVITADYHLLPEGEVVDIIGDLKNLENWFLREGSTFGIDLGRVAIAGSSAGSLVSVLALSTWKTLRPRVFYSLYGMLDVTDPWYSTPKGEDSVLGSFKAVNYQEENIRHFLEPGRPAVWDDRSGVMDLKGRIAYFVWLLKEGKLGLIVRRSLKDATGTENLLDLVDTSFPPTITVHGTADTITPVTDSQKLARALVGKSVRSQSIEIDGANHGLNPGEQYSTDLERSIDLFELWFGGNSL